MSDTKVRLGDMVDYRDGNGRLKTALVIATADSVSEGSYLEAPAVGTAHLKVFSPSGNIYDSRDIPEGEGAHTFTVR